MATAAADDGVDIAPRRRLRSVRLRRGLRWLGATLLTSCITLFGLLVVTFALGRVLPADPVLRIVGDRASQEQYDEVFRQLRLDRPLTEQFAA